MPCRRVLPHSCDLVTNAEYYQSGSIEKPTSMQQLQHTKALSLLCILAFLVLSVQARTRLCGPQLNEALDKICVNGFNTRMKRTFVPPEYNDLEDGAGGSGSLDYQPLMSRMFGESAYQLLKTRRRRYGISDECCIKGCNYSELFSYCR